MRRWGVVALLVAASCGGVDDTLPRIDLIGEAVAAVVADTGGDPALFEVLADREGVTVTVAETEIDTASGDVTGRFARSYRFEGGELAEPTEPVPAEGAEFAASAVPSLDSAVASGVREALNDPRIVDLAISGAPDGAVVIDLTVVSDMGGRILVLVRPDGTVLGVQAD